MKKTILTACIAACAGMASAAFAADGKFPPLGPLPPVKAPPDNPTTPAKVELGRKLFWDGRLSGNGAMPCVACHQPQLGWETNGAISMGYPGTIHWRSSQTIYNSAYYNKLFWDGTSTSLEAQAKSAAGGSVAGNGDDSMMEMRLAFVPEYRKAFKEIFGTEYPMINDAYRAIAAFQRTIISDPKKVPFDRFASGDAAALSDAAKRGKDLFEGKANCISCHNGPLVTDERFYRLGVPDPQSFADDPVQQITHRWQVYQKGVSEKVYRSADTDHGLYYATKRPDDMGKFRTPSLRELKYTAPYMHNGAFETLDDVVAFYNGGAGKGSGLKPLNLGETEAKDLVAFLESLSMDEPLIVEEPKLPETKPLTTSAKGK